MKSGPVRNERRSPNRQHNPAGGATGRSRLLANKYKFQLNEARRIAQKKPPPPAGATAQLALRVPEDDPSATTPSGPDGVADLVETARSWTCIGPSPGAATFFAFRSKKIRKPSPAPPAAEQPVAVRVERQAVRPGP